MAKQRIGILGGTFDPVHCGHLQIARFALEAAGLDQVLLLPSGNPEYKRCSASREDRWMMVVAACRGDGALVPCRLEIDRKGTTYTADTIPMLQSMYPGAKLFWILGADSLMRIRSWHRADDIIRCCRLLVFRRSGEADADDLASEVNRLQEMGGRIKMLSAEILSCSSGAIRAALADHQIPSALDLCVRELIEAKGLYGLPARVPESAVWLPRLFAALKPHRFAHSLAVASEARNMAARFGEDPLRAEKAGLLHDCAKYMQLSEMRRIAVENHLDADQDFLASPALLHSVVGAWVAEHEYGMTDPEVLEAVACHNTGRPGMSRLAMCVALSDSIEPTRSSYPLLSEIRALAERSLEKALLLSLESTARFVASRGAFLHPRTQETIAWLKTLPAVLNLL